MTWDGIPEHRNRRDGGGQPPQLPADPFGGMTAPAVATVEMFRAHVEAGLTEQQALFFCACLVQVGLAIQGGGLLDRMPPWDQDPPGTP